MAGSVQRQKVYVQVTDWRLFGEGIASGLDYARKPRESPPNNSALCSHPRPGPVDIALYLPGPGRNFRRGGSRWRSLHRGGEVSAAPADRRPITPPTTAVDDAVRP